MIKPVTFFSKLISHTLPYSATIHFLRYYVLHSDEDLIHKTKTVAYTVITLDFNYCSFKRSANHLEWGPNVVKENLDIDELTIKMSDENYLVFLVYILILFVFGYVSYFGKKQNKIFIYFQL